MTNVATSESHPPEVVAEEAIGRLPGAVFAVDDQLRVIACSPETQQALRLASGEILGRQCHDILALVDVETGRPCYEHCPLAPGSGRPGWAHSRALEVNHSDGQKVRLDCLLLQCLAPNGKQSNLCFLGQPLAPERAAHLRVLRAIEEVYPAVSGVADLKEVLAVSLRALLRATAADGGVVFLADPETGELVLRERQGLSIQTADALRKYLVGWPKAGLVGSPQLPLLAVGTWPTDEVGGMCGWYLSAPLVAKGRAFGALGVAGRRRDFDVVMATRILFPVAAQLGAYLGWAYLTRNSARVGATESPHEAAARLRIHCLGTFRLVMEGKPLPMDRFRRLKALALLRFLAAHRGKPIPRETLMELLWPDADPERANGNLRVVLHALRRGLEPDLGRGEASAFVVSKGDLVYLDPSERVWVDAEEFVAQARQAERLASQGRAEEAMANHRRAVTLYQGDYLEDEPYSDWCLFERERLKEVYINLQKQMGSILADMDDVAGAVESYREALRVDQGREEVHRELMQLLCKSGQRDEAARQYQVCRRVLRDELGVEPTQETEAVYAAMRAGDCP